MKNNTPLPIDNYLFESFVHYKIMSPIDNYLFESFIHYKIMSPIDNYLFESFIHSKNHFNVTKKNNMNNYLFGSFESFV